ncbi:MAG TPA: peptidylprolyl isomerase [Phycisphaerales bacterium]|nr:peptidylprolyl isomerase [Phycisphaerales bacterium]HMP36314.1 peptidylprolyl isomerase [Phycisphaerales bacterium]
MEPTTPAGLLSIALAAALTASMPTEPQSADEPEPRTAVRAAIGPEGRAGQDQQRSAAIDAPARGAVAEPLRPLRHFVGINRAALVRIDLAGAAEIEAERGADSAAASALASGEGDGLETGAPRQARAPALALSIQEHDGHERARIAGLDPGEIDLAAAWPELWALERAVWLQLIVDDVAVGAPLVVQPLRNRPVVRTAEAIRPDGRTPYTRIVGWGDEAIDPPSAEVDRLKEAWKPGEPIVNAGVRLSVDRDVVLETSAGTIVVALRPDEAPNTAWNFRMLAEGGFYDETIFHRIVPVDRAGRPFVIQGGDPTGSGDGGPGWDLPIERSRIPHEFGVISMARADDPDSAGSQFFFALSREGTARLDGQYCAFGHAVEGAETIVAIAESEIADPLSGRPVDAPRILAATLRPAPPRTPGTGRPDAPVELPAPPPPQPAGDSR